MEPTPSSTLLVKSLWNTELNAPMKNMSSLKHVHREHFSKVLVQCRTEPAHRSRTCLANPLWNAGKEINSCETRNAQTLRRKIISHNFRFDTWKRALHLGLFSSVMQMGFKRMEEWPEANQPSRQHCRCSVYSFFMCIVPDAGCSSCA
jgi:hypothetical protein